MPFSDGPHARQPPRRTLFDRRITGSPLLPLVFRGRRRLLWPYPVMLSFVKMHHCAKNKSVIFVCTTSYNTNIVYTKLKDFIRMVYNSCDVRTAYRMSGTSGRYGKWDRCAGTLVMPTFVLLCGVPSRSPTKLRIFPNIFHIYLPYLVILVSY